MLGMRVKDWMTCNPTTVNQMASVSVALKILQGQHFRRLPVLNDEDRLVGMVTAKNLKEALPNKATTLSLWELHELMTRLLVRDVMARKVVTCKENDCVEDVALLMEKHKVGGLPVLDETGQLSGMLTITDVLKAFIHVMGYDAGGKRLTLTLQDVPGSLARAAEAIAPSNILSIATSGQTPEGRQLVLRVVGTDLESVEERIRAAGLSLDTSD